MADVPEASAQIGAGSGAVSRAEAELPPRYLSEPEATSWHRSRALMERITYRTSIFETGTEYVRPTSVLGGEFAERGREDLELIVWSCIDAGEEVLCLWNRTRASRADLTSSLTPHSTRRVPSLPLSTRSVPSRIRGCRSAEQSRDPRIFRCAT
jgi:hypothetical protein